MMFNYDFFWSSPCPDAHEALNKSAGRLSLFSASRIASSRWPAGESPRHLCNELVIDGKREGVVKLGAARFALLPGRLGSLGDCFVTYSSSQRRPCRLFQVTASGDDIAWRRIPPVAAAFVLPSPSPAHPIPPGFARAIPPCCAWHGRPGRCAHARAPVPA